MHISLGRRDNHATILRKAGVRFGVLHAMVDLTDPGQTDKRTNGRTDMNEGGSLYISAFGTKTRAKKSEKKKQTLEPC